MNPTDSNQNNDSLAMSQAGSADSAGGGVGKTTICHIPPGNPANAHSITVGNPAVRAHLAHGDKIGSCPEVISQKPKCSDESSKGGSHHGMSPDRTGGKVAVCHIPPGNPANMHTIVIGAAAVRAHLAHGDKLGACEGESVVAEVSSDCGATNHGNGGHPHDGDTGSGDNGTGGTGTGEGGNDSGGSGGSSGTDSTLNY